MKIALLHYSAPPVVGGVESVIAQHARLMADDGHEVCMVAGRGDQIDPRIPFIRIPLADSRHVEILAMKAELDAGCVPGQFVELVARIYSDLSEQLQGYDILIAHNVCSLNKNLALTAALKQITETPGSPYLIQWHHDLAWTTPRYHAELHDGYPWDLLRRHWPGVRQVVVSELRRKELAGLQDVAQESISFIPNGMQFTRFLKLEPRTAQFIYELNLFDVEPLILLPVRITPRKNIELALQVLAVLRSQYPKAGLVVTGPLGPHNPANQEYFKKLFNLRRELALEDIAYFLAEWTDQYLPDEVIADFYRLADVLLLPSLEEGFGIPVIEAAISWLPIFCSDIPPLRALAGTCASYFSLQARPEQIAAQIDDVLSTSLTYQLRVRVRRKYSWDDIYRNMILPLLMEPI